MHQDEMLDVGLPGQYKLTYNGRIYFLWLCNLCFHVSQFLKDFPYVDGWVDYMNESRDG